MSGCGNKDLVSSGVREEWMTGTLGWCGDNDKVGNQGQARAWRGKAKKGLPCGVTGAEDRWVVKWLGPRWREFRNTDNSLVAQEDEPKCPLNLSSGDPVPAPKCQPGASLRFPSVESGDGSWSWPFSL